MRVEIEISDEEALQLRDYGFDVYQANSGIAATMAHRVGRALPRPIQVGDTVKAKTSHGNGVVLLVYDKWVFVKWEGYECPEAWEKTRLDVVALAAAAALEKETPQ